MLKLYKNKVPTLLRLLEAFSPRFSFYNRVKLRETSTTVLPELRKNPLKTKSSLKKIDKGQEAETCRKTQGLGYNRVEKGSGIDQKSQEKGSQRCSRTLFPWIRCSWDRILGELQRRISISGCISSNLLIQVWRIQNIGNSAFCKDFGAKTKQ